MKYSKFAKHFDPHSGILQLMSDLEHGTRSDSDVKMLGGGNPAMIPSMEAVFRREMLHIMNNGRQFEDMAGNYDAPQGNARFIEELAAMLNRYLGWHIDSRHIAITNGSQSSFGVLFNLFSGQFDDGSNKKVLLPMTPEYIGYGDVGFSDYQLFRAHRPVIHRDPEDPLFYKYGMNSSGITIDHTTGAMCVSRPTNPTGNVLTDEEIQQLNSLSIEHDIPLILDCAYGLPFPGIIFTSARTPEWHDNLIICMSLSKLGLPGVRTGIVIANPEVVALIKSANAIYSLAPGRFGPTLMTRLVADDELVQICGENIMPFYKTRVTQVVDLIRDAFEGLPVRVHRPEGAIFLWLWFEDLPITTQVLYERLKQRSVYVIAGRHFFPGLEEPWAHRDQCIRISYTAHWENVVSGIHIIAEEVRKAYAS